MTVGKLCKGWVGDTAGIMWEGNSKAIRQIPQAGRLAVPVFRAR